jgi:hypothetical protein
MLHWKAVYARISSAPWRPEVINFASAVVNNGLPVAKAVPPHTERLCQLCGNADDCVYHMMCDCTAFMPLRQWVQRMAGPGRLNFSVLVDDKSVGRYLTYGDADGSDTSPSALLRGAALWAIRATRSHWITGWGDKTSGVWTHSGVRMTSQSTVTAARCELRLLATNMHTRKRPTSADAATEVPAYAHAWQGYCTFGTRSIDRSGCHDA